MNKELTEQWKNGKIEQGEYWCKITESPYVERVYLPCCDDIIVEVLAPVPSYEEWQRIFHYAGKYEHEYTSCVMDYENLKQENQQLKELLLACQAYFNNQPNDNWAKSIVMDIDNAIGEKK